MKCQGKSRRSVDGGERLTARLEEVYAVLHAMVLLGSRVELGFQLGIENLHVLEAAFGVPSWSKSVRITGQIGNPARGGKSNLVFCGRGVGSRVQTSCRLRRLLDGLGDVRGGLGALWLLLGQRKRNRMYGLRDVGCQAQVLKGRGQRNITGQSFFRTDTRKMVRGSRAHVRGARCVEEGNLWTSASCPRGNGDGIDGSSGTEWKWWHTLSLVGKSRLLIAG